MKGERLAASEASRLQARATERRGAGGLAPVGRAASSIAMAQRSFALVVAAALAAGGCGASASGSAGKSSGSSSASSSSGAMAPPSVADAFVWGYPLVVTQRTLQTFASVIGVNTLFNQTALSNASTRLVVSPNTDTLYSVAVVDLRSEPMVLTVPDVTDRYWTYQFLDAFTTSFHYIGTRTTAGNGGQFVITAPGWKGALPAGAVQVAAPTPTMFLLGRYLVKGTADIPNVTALARTLAPLSTLTGTQAPPPPPALGSAPGTPQSVGTTGGDFFDELGDALAVNPPASAFDAGILQSLSPLGIGAGDHPYAKANAASDAMTTAALDAGVSAGMSRIAAAAASSGTEVSGWRVHLDIGMAPTDTLLRAVIADVGWGANLPAEAVYARSTTDAAGAAYTGAKSYLLHIPAGLFPPVDPTSGFWSVTLYGPDHFFYANPQNRYALGSDTAGLAFNTDGSLDVYIQNAAPTGQANWIPAPAGAFELMMRLYLPESSVLGGTYPYPPVVVH
jgi:hypothetical protein